MGDNNLKAQRYSFASRFATFMDEWIVNYQGAENLLTYLDRESAHAHGGWCSALLLAVRRRVSAATVA